MRLEVMAPTPLQKTPQISPILKADTVRLHVSREKDGNRAWSTPGSDAAKADLLGEVPALRCPAVTCNVG
jgi:hypothetical protein